MSEIATPHFGQWLEHAKSHYYPKIDNSQLRRLLIMLCLLVCTAMHAERMERVFFLYDASDGMAANSAQTIKCTDQGRIVITSIGHVHFFNGGSFTHIDPQSANEFPLPSYSGHYHLYFDHHNLLWVKDKYKVTCLDLMKEQFIVNVDSVIKHNGMQEAVEDMFGDSENYMYYQSKNRLYCPGRHLVVPIRETAQLHDVDIYDNHILLLFFANGIVSAYDLSKGSYLYDLPSWKDEDQAHYSESSVIYPDGRFYYQIRNGKKDAILMRYDAGLHEWKELMRTPYHLNNMILFDGILFVASEKGYWEYNPVSGEKKHQELLKLTSGRLLQTDVNAIGFDHQGGMWLGTEKRGLLYAKPFTSPFYTYSLSEPEALNYMSLLDNMPGVDNLEPLGRHVNCKYTDSRGWTWTGLYTGVQLERPGHKPYMLTFKDGMMNEMVHSVIEDDFHDIWASTSNGICHFFISGDSVSRIESYYDRDNIPNESFVNRRVMKLNDGTIVMQALDHIVTFNPHHFHTDSMSRMVLIPQLIHLMVNGHDIRPGMKLGSRVILEQSLNSTRNFSVGYNQNTMMLSFSGSNFLRPTQTYYRFRVKELNDEWRMMSYFNSDGRVDVNGLLRLPLVGLKPGTYTVEMQVSMSPEEWPQEPVAWTINVEEPWWRTSGLYVLLALLVLGILLANFYFYNKTLQLRMDVFGKQADLKHRVTSYAIQCKSFENEILTPQSLKTDGYMHIDSTFAEIMTKVVPFVQQCDDKDVSFDMQQLADMAGVSMSQLYHHLSLHFNESPRLMMLRLRLSMVAKMLTETDKTKEEIAEELGFASPNYMIASFYHYYRQTPDDYRNSTAR